jgi:hypothetical protein
MLRQAVSRRIGEQKAEREQLEKGRHICRRVTAALQKEMFASLSSGGGGLDFASASAPVIVYSLENHFLDADLRRQLAFKCVNDYRDAAACVSCNVLHQIRGGRWAAGSACVLSAARALRS